MRLVATEYVSLDGVFEEPGRWSLPFFGDEVAAFKFRELQESDALLLGRRTYEGFAAAWPTMEGTGEFGVKMNTMPKYVVSSTLDEAGWTGSVIIDGDVEREVARLKQATGGDLLLAGSGQLLRALRQANLVDVYRFMVHPVLLGDGERLFGAGDERRDLRLARHEIFETGIVILDYEPAS